MSLDQRFAEAMGALLGPDFPSDIGLAVSGGGDSMAMLTMAHNWAHVWGARLWVVTVDHGLRPESASEAAMVAGECACLGWPHATLRWHWDGQGNLMDAARRGRLEVIDRWRAGLEHVLFAHTADDLAETFVMRLARGSGVEGLSAMRASVSVRPHRGGKTWMDARDVCWTAPPPGPTRRVAGVGAYPSSFQVIRPCLEMTRAELRHYLSVLKGRWVEDPTNEDRTYERVRVRQAMDTLAELGLTPERLAQTAGRMGRAREALQSRAAQAWDEIGREDRLDVGPGVQTGDLLFDRDGFEAVERDTQLRLLAAALQWVSGAEYRPRAEPLEALLDRVLGGGGGTLHGCEARMERAQLRVFREYAAVRNMTAPCGKTTLWDGRWSICVEQYRDDQSVEIRALGEDGWAQIAEKPDGAPSYRSARSLPALWRGDSLLACTAMGFGSQPLPTMRLWPLGQEVGHFRRFLLSH